MSASYFARRFKAAPRVAVGLNERDALVVRRGQAGRVRSAEDSGDGIDVAEMDSIPPAPSVMEMVFVPAANATFKKSLQTMFTVSPFPASPTTATISAAPRCPVFVHRTVSRPGQAIFRTDRR